MRNPYLRACLRLLTISWGCEDCSIFSSSVNPKSRTIFGVLFYCVMRKRSTRVYGRCKTVSARWSQGEGRREITTALQLQGRFGALQALAPVRHCAKATALFRAGMRQKTDRSLCGLVHPPPRSCHSMAYLMQRRFQYRHRWTAKRVKNSLSGLSETMGFRRKHLAPPRSLQPPPCLWARSKDHGGSAACCTSDAFDYPRSERYSCSV